MNLEESKKTKKIILILLLVIYTAVIYIFSPFINDNRDIQLKIINDKVEVLSLVNYTSAVDIETNEIFLVNRKTHKIKYIITDTLAIQILTAKEYQLQIMEYKKIISK